MFFPDGEPDANHMVCLWFSLLKYFLDQYPEEWDDILPEITDFEAVSSCTVFG